MRVDAGEEDSMMKWLVCVYLSIRYVLCVMCDFDKHITMFCVTYNDVLCDRHRSGRAHMMRVDASDVCEMMLATRTA